ncbi:hypothetical protein WJX72_000067 [[Myrmecia] bisecta]|uniref:Homologous-pairing protein 2 homolog n=1 Tax=[Myrmecia] bisecta TaxID=41462 RepID=A0AAW1R3S6_9CHLO
MAEARVLNYIKEQNRPFNVQNIADMMAQFGIKKGQIQKAVDSLVEEGKVICKEFGKSKIYMPPQDEAEVLPKEEMDAKQKRLKELTEQATQEAEVLRGLQKELAGLNSSLTLEEITAQLETLQQQVSEKEKKVNTLRSGCVLVSKEQRAAVEKAFSQHMDQWQKRRRIFKNIWDSISENMDQNQADMFEEMGVETDEAAQVSHAELAQLAPKKARR